MEHSRVNTVLSRTMLSALAVFMTVQSPHRQHGQLITGTLTEPERSINAAMPAPRSPQQHANRVVRQPKTDEWAASGFSCCPQALRPQAVSPDSVIRRTGSSWKWTSQALPIRLDVGQLTERSR